MADGESVPVLTDDVTALGQEYERKLEELERQLAALTTSVNRDRAGRTGNQNIPDTTVPQFQQHGCGKREFRISGQIGDKNQKDRLGFTSLSHQIENGLKRGYTEEDIIEAVIRATNPGLSLRSYMESKSDITLSRLRQILRSHYQERGATELFKDLSGLTQKGNETPQEFMVRALDLRQQVLFATKENDSNQQYDKPLVQSMFQHAVLTGLSNQAISSDLKPYLVRKDIGDEVLLEMLNASASNEVERAKKFKSKYGAMGVEQSRGGNNAPKATTSSDKPDELLYEVRALRAEVRELRSFHKGPPEKKQADGSEQNSRFPRKRVCPNCQKEGQDYCYHCFKCGSGEHFARGCRMQRGNAQGPTLGDKGGAQ